MQAEDLDQRLRGHAPEISSAQAFLHIVKGNFGPGCLALPAAFSRVGWPTALAGLVLVSVQGIYSMRLLSRLNSALDPQGTGTFAFLGRLCFGRVGDVCVRLLLCALQLGVCCVFIELVGTNMVVLLQGAISRSVVWMFLTAVFLALALVRHIGNMWVFSLAATAIMALAVLASSVEATSRLASNATLWSAAKTKPDGAADVALCLGALFFAYEGMALVLPVGNSLQASSRAAFPCTLVGAMSTMSVVFGILGLLCSVAYPNLRHGSAAAGSIPAFIQEELRLNGENVLFFQVINVGVSLAVMLTFPLQLFPAMEALFPPHELDETMMTEEEETDSLVADQRGDGGPHARPMGRRKDTAARVVIVAVCMCITFVIDDISLMVSVFGCLCQSGLAMLPCLMHLKLQRQGALQHLPDLNTGIVGAAIDVGIIAFCCFVSVVGTVSSIEAFTKE